MLAAKEDFAHENLTRERHVVRGSERSFVIMMAGVCRTQRFWHEGRVQPLLIAIAGRSMIVRFFSALPKPLNCFWSNLC
jgi:hypothetical protein